MKKFILIFLCGLLVEITPLFAQDIQSAETEPKAALTVGVLQGGGSLIGADIEFLLGNRVGIQGGAGFVGFGAGLNYHLKPSIRSSFISLQYWHQGAGETFTQSLLGPGFVYRANKIFTASLGLGFALEEGPAWPDDKDQPPVMLTYSIGIYFPLK
jgi:hypothetical protein